MGLAGLAAAGKGEQCRCCLGALAVIPEWMEEGLKVGCITTPCHTKTDQYITC